MGVQGTPKSAELIENLKKFRTEYRLGTLDEGEIKQDPFEQFEFWFDQVQRAAGIEPNAMCLSTVSADGTPANRMVLLKNYSREGFVFFTNYNSQKAEDLKRNPRAAILFYWPEFQRQVRIIGDVNKIPDSESDKYFKTRPIGAQLATYVSDQSSIISGRDELDRKWASVSKEYEGKDISRPKHWGGYLVSPERFEFWQGRENRLHDRIEYNLNNNIWVSRRLSP